MGQRYFLQIVLPVFALIMLIVAIVLSFSHPEVGASNSPTPAPTTPFKNTVAGVGIVEPENGFIQVGTLVPGVVAHVYVTEGQQVKAGEPLFKLDDDEMNAEIKLAKVKLAAANRELNDVNNNSPRSIVHLAEEKVNEARADLAVITARYNNLTVKSPSSGIVLKVNVHPGESVPMTGESPLVLASSPGKWLRVRVEVDETDVARITPQSHAIGMLRGNANKPITLKFVRKEPLVEPKKILTGQGNELVDTRVLPIIYLFDNSLLGAYPGQHMDVFIESAKTS